MRPIFPALFACALAAGLVVPPAAAASPIVDRVSAATPGADVYAIDTAAHSVVRFAGGTAAPTTVATGFTDPETLVVDRYNAAYVIDDGTRQLIRVAAGSGAKSVLRSNLSADARPTMSVDGKGDVYLLDDRAIVRYAADTGAATAVGTSALAGVLTVDGAGNVSVTAQLEFDGQVVVDTYPASGAAPTRRSLPPDLSVGGIKRVIETAGGALYIWVYAGGGSGAQYIERLNADSTVDDISTTYGDFMDTVDRRGNYYLLQTRHWCSTGELGQGTCADDFAVDAVMNFAPPRVPSVSRPVTGVSLPLGGIAVDDAGNLYAAEVPFDWEPAGLHVPPAQIVRVDAAGTSTVLASGSYLDPVVANTTVLNTVPGRSSAVSATVSGSRATLTWTAPASNGGSPITGYRVSRNGTDSKGTGPWSTVVPATASSFVFGNLVPGSSYLLSVQAINAIGSGAAASTTAAVPAVTASSPQAFTLVVNVGSHSVTETWTPPASTGGAPITGYRVARDGVDSRGTGRWSTILPATARSQTFNLLVPGYRYTFSVSAITAAGVGAPAFGRATG